MRIDLGSDDRVLALPYVNVSDGLWHTARMRRWGNQAVLQLDGGDGRYVTLATSLPICCNDSSLYVYIRATSNRKREQHCFHFQAVGVATYSVAVPAVLYQVSAVVFPCCTIFKSINNRNVLCS